MGMVGCSPGWPSMADAGKGRQRQEKACPVVGCESHSAAEVSSDGALVLWLRCTCLMFHGHCGDIVMTVVVQLGSDWLRCKCNCRHFSALLAKLPFAFARFGLWKMAGPGCGWMGLAKVDGEADVASYWFYLIADSAFCVAVAVAADADLLVLS
ncbi:hypothetical protein Nepgr_020354 [Nepenthes gracilis]|uniref:Uncharacterized protein n=1 Tax=Nepenthes gracilis TaxID=150966 RepID=A0AAD3SUX4_NEPGR|nr:hypothetical protein Nepgr_020354 [Nepenthes gracilis]